MTLETMERWATVTIAKPLAWAMYGTWLGACWIATGVRSAGLWCYRWYSRRANAVGISR